MSAEPYEFDVDLELEIAWHEQAARELARRWHFLSALEALLWAWALRRCR